MRVPSVSWSQGRENDWLIATSERIRQSIKWNLKLERGEQVNVALDRVSWIDEVVFCDELLGHSKEGSEAVQ